LTLCLLSFKSYNSPVCTFKAPPPQTHHNSRGRRGGGGRGSGRNDYNNVMDGPVAPLVKTENRWMPIKDTSVLVVTEKKVKSILNKMTKEKFESLAGKMCDIPISSHDILTKMIHYVYEKAIYEPNFGDIYAELCSRLSQKAMESPFVKIIESDEEPPTEDGTQGVDDNIGSSGNIVYRWSNDVTTDDAEVIGPFESPEACLEAATNPDSCPEPVKREDRLTIAKLKIHRGLFVKIMHPEQEETKFYTVFFPMKKAKEIGQQFSEDIFLSDRECIKDSKKANSFKSILLNKCEDEFKKQDIFVEWKKEKTTYDARRSNLSDSERLEMEEELEFRRMKIKKQMLGNIRFIGELYKKGMLKVKIMKFCIHALLKMDERQNGEIIFKDDHNEMDEEDHEAVCKLFITIGRKIDTDPMRYHLDCYFKQMKRMSADKRLNSRCRFMYKDLIELRQNDWKARRELETTKTLDEIRRDVEREERMAAQQSQGSYRGGRHGGDRRGGSGAVGGRRNSGGRGDHRDDNRRDMTYNSSGRNKSQRERNIVQDQDGFTQVLNRNAGPVTNTFGRSSQQQKFTTPPTPTLPPPASERLPSEPSTSPAALSEEKLKLRAKNMRAEFMDSKGDIENLLMTMDELKHTPGANKIIVQVSLDSAIDCKDAERKAIISMISILFRKKKISCSDIEVPMAELIEFIDSFILDSPGAMTYLGQMLSEFLFIKVLTVSWICEQSKKLEEFSKHLIPDVIVKTIDAFKVLHGVENARLMFDPQKSSLSSLLGVEKWDNISREKLL